MNYAQLVTTIVAGFLGAVLLICTTVLLVVGVEVPSEYIPALLMLLGVAVGGAGKATAP